VNVRTMATTQTLNARRDVKEKAIRNKTATLDVVTWKANGTAGLIGHVLMNAATHRNTGTELASIHTVTTQATGTVRLLALERIQMWQTVSMDVVNMLVS